MNKPSPERIEFLLRSLEKCRRLLRSLQRIRAQEFKEQNRTENWLAIRRKELEHLKAQLSPLSEGDIDGGQKSLESEPDLLKIQETLRILKVYNGLAHTVRDLQIWDFSVYDRTPSLEWLALPRSDYENIRRQLAQFDLWEPWGTKIQRRLGSSRSPG